MKLSIYYRGALTSCNYACGYCPFAKRTESRATQLRDRDSLQRFAGWVADAAGFRWTIVFTPWGEALVRRWYRDAVVRLTQLPHVELVAVQTNLSCGIDWTLECPPERLGLWAAFHPGQARLDGFLGKVERLKDRGVRISVGMVATQEHLDLIDDVKRRLPAGVTMWVNPQQPRPRPYTDDEVARLAAVDPCFPTNLKRARSLDRFCPAGETSFTVDEHGDMRRCHFVDEHIGNLYDDSWRAALRRRRCPKRFCHCYLGKSQLSAADLHGIVGDRSPLPVIT